MIKYAPFTVKQAEYIRRCQSCWLNVAEGGKRAGKNIINLVAWAAALDTHPDKIHLAAGTSVSAAKRMSGEAAMIPPLRHGMMPVGNGTSSRKVVAWS